MKRVFLPSAFLALVLLLVTGCSGTSTSRPAFTAVDQDTSFAMISGIRVFVGDDEKGLTPGTFQVRRGFGEHLVTLRRGREVVRMFEVEPVYTSNAADLAFGFDRDTSGDMLRYDLSQLNVKNDGTYIIPHLGGQPLAIEDRKYGLTLVVRN